MKLKAIVDEHISDRIAHALASQFAGHQICSVRGLGLSGTKDVDLFDFARREQFNTLLTRDAMHMVRLDETARLRASRMHWLCVPQITGLKGGLLEDNLLFMFAEGIRELFKVTHGAPGDVVWLKLDKPQRLHRPAFNRITP